MSIYYEWDLETVNEHGDIEDHEHAKHIKDLPYPEPNQRLVLVRNSGNAHGVAERWWWYPTLDDEATFGEGIRVPKKYLAQYRQRATPPDGSPGPASLRRLLSF